MQLIPMSAEWKRQMRKAIDLDIWYLTVFITFQSCKFPDVYKAVYVWCVWMVESLIWGLRLVSPVSMAPGVSSPLTHAVHSPQPWAGTVSSGKHGYVVVIMMMMSCWWLWWLWRMWREWRIRRLWRLYKFLFLFLFKYCGTEVSFKTSLHIAGLGLDKLWLIARYSPWSASALPHLQPRPNPLYRSTFKLIKTTAKHSTLFIEQRRTRIRLKPILACG